MMREPSPPSSFVYLSQTNKEHLKMLGTDVMKKALSIATLIFGIFLCQTASGQIVVTFADNGPFDNIFAGTSVDLSSFDQGNSSTGHNFGATFNLTATSTGEDLNVATNGRLGIANSPGSTNSFFNVGESMTFNFDIGGDGVGAALLDKLVFESMATDGTEKFTLSSSSFNNRGYESKFGTDTSAAIAFNEATDTFTFTNTTGSQDVTFDLTGFGVPVTILEGDSAVLGFTDNTTGFAGFSGFTIHAVPEPAALGLLSVCLAGFVCSRRKKKSRLSSGDSSSDAA